MPQNLNTLFRDLSFSTSDDFVKGIDLNHRGDGIKARHIPSILRFIQKTQKKVVPKTLYPALTFGGSRNLKMEWNIFHLLKWHKNSTHILVTAKYF